MSPELKFIAKQLAAIRKDLADIKKVVFCGDKFKIDLPLEDIKELEDVNAKIIADQNFFVHNLVKYYLDIVCTRFFF